MSEKNKLAEKLLYAPKNGYDRLSAEDEKAMEAYCEDYKKFLNNGKTERLCVEYCIELAEKKGFKSYEAGMKLSVGDKVYFNNRGKGIMLAVIGSEDLSHGANIGAAHTDSPRLDLKPRPLYEEAEMAYFKTHHYGGIRKYQWVTIPLELHGVVVLHDGSKVDVHIGGKEDDPQFIINDLLPHLGREQGKKPLNEAIPSESLNVLLGGKPFEDKDCSDRFKLGVLQYLNAQYGITEEDFISAELEVVPAGKARDIGFDRSFIASYGHDDRVCAYAELAGIFDAVSPKKTAVCIFADKEEIGSEGVSGMLSQAFDKFMADLCEAQGVALRDCLANSFCLSADVTAAYDFTLRQAGYYTAAARFLGLIRKDGAFFRLTDEGRRVLSLSYRKRQAALTSRMARSRVFRALLNLGAHKPSPVTVEEARELLRTERPPDVWSEKTLSRRASTAVSWVTWLLRPQGEEEQQLSFFPG